MTTTESANPTDAARRNIEAILPLLPLQKALYLRGVLSDDDPGFLQVQCRLHGDLDRGRLEAAWNEVVRANAALRMSCRGREGSDPMVIVWKTVSLPWIELDWRDAHGEEQARRLSDFLARDRAKGLDLAEAPVMRVGLIRVDDEAYELVWTCHHLFVDGWSAALVLEQLLDRYGNRGTGTDSPPANAYRRYHSWAAELDQRDSREFWRDRLGGFVPAGRLELDEPLGPATGQEAIEREIDGDLVGAVLESASALRVPPNAVLQGAWGLVVAALNDSDDIVFGTTVAGRAAPVDGMERLVGFFSNVIPVRVTVTDDTTVRDWLRERRDQQFATQSHESSFLSDIQDWSGVPGRQPLFETLLVVENFPAASAADGADSITLEGFRSGITTTFPLTLALALGERWTARFTYDTARFGPVGVGSLLDAFLSALRALTENPDRRVADLCAAVASLVPPRRHGPTDTPRRASRVAGRDGVERQLIMIMEEVLGVEDIDLRDDYFDLGGTSIQAVRLFDAIERRLGVRLPVATLLGGATIEHLASVLRERGPSNYESLVPIQTEGSKRPLACVHAGELHVLFYRPLAILLGSDQPVYGFEPVGRNGERAPLDDFREIAAIYVRELREIQPEGPYRLLGYCLGGTLCWEMAHQLEALGEEVELLALLDTPYPYRPRSTAAGRAWSILRSDGIGAVARRGAAKVTRRRARARTLSGSSDRVLTANWVREACRRGFQAYVPPRCRAKVTLIHSSQYAKWPRAAENRRWTTLAGDAAVEIVESQHDQLLLEPALSEIAALLRDRL